MNRITEKFRQLVARSEKAFIPFITAGDPDMETTEVLLQCLAENGADMIEIGIPFSDPMADGLTIQASSQRALRNPFSMDLILNLVRRFRARHETPVILFGYYNPFFQYGLTRLVRNALDSGVDGLLVVDLPPEEAHDLLQAAAQNGLDIIFLIAPTSTDERIRLIAKHASGFIYYVSLTGVTGARQTLTAGMAGAIARIRRFTSLPIGVGFGVSSPEHVREISGYADAIIVGSAIIKKIEELHGQPDLLKQVGLFVSTLKKATLPE